MAATLAHGLIELNIHTATHHPLYHHSNHHAHAQSVTLKAPKVPPTTAHHRRQACHMDRCRSTIVNFKNIDATVVCALLPHLPHPPTYAGLSPATVKYRAVACTRIDLGIAPRATTALSTPGRPDLSRVWYVEWYRLDDSMGGECSKVEK